jgi:hypothetical protein
MLDALKIQLAFPTGAYTPATTYTAHKRGDSMSSSQYVLAPADIKTATSSDVAQALASYNLNRRSPGQGGTSRSQVLLQVAAVDIKGAVRVWSFSGVIAQPNGFVPAAGTTVDSDALTRAVVAGGVGMLLNPDADTTTPRTQRSVTDSLVLGIVP